MSKQLENISSLLPLGSLNAYISQINRVPLLSLEEEQHFSKRFHETGDLEAARHLVLAHLRYVVRIARGYMGYGLPLNDLIQEGNVGLMKAVKRFDPAVGVRLVSFAVHWIKAEIHEFILRNWRIVKIATTKAQRKLFFNLRKMKTRLNHWFNAEEVDAVAQDLGVSREDVLAMEQRLSAVDSAYDGPINDEEDDSFVKSPASFLFDPSHDPAYQIETATEQNQGQHQLSEALQRLDARSQDILQQRWLVEEKSTLQALAEKYGVSTERIRQLEKNAMKKVRQYIEAFN